MENLDLKNELVILIKYHVENKLTKYNRDYLVDLSYELRDNCVTHTYKIIQKKYLNNHNFEINKENIINLIIENYISKKYLENQF